MSKDLGSLVELRFQLAAATHGFTVNQPHGDNAPYDYILDDGLRLYKVQVKSADFIDKRRPNIYAFQLCRGYTKRSYQPHEVDYFALYLVKQECFFLIPQGLLAGRLVLKMTVDGKFKAFKENWQLQSKEEARGCRHQRDQGSPRRLN